MQTGKISILIILLVFLNFGLQMTTRSTSELILPNNVVNDSPLSYKLKAIDFITYPLFTTPALVFPGNVLNITATLSQNTQVTTVMLENADGTLESSFTTNYDAENQRLVIQFNIPASAKTGLYSLIVNSTDGNDFTWHSVRIGATIGSQISIVHVTDTHIGIKGYSTLEALTMVVNAINLIRPQPAFVVHTGDLIDWGTSGNITARYEAALSTLANLSIPLFIINGNHEKYANLSYWDAFLGPAYQHSVSYGPLHLTLTSLRDQDGVTASELAWIQNDIATHAAQTTIFAYHYDFGTQFEDIGAAIHLAGHEHRSFVEDHSDYLKIVTGNSYYQNENELGEIRLLNFNEGRLESYPIIEFGEDAVIGPLPSGAPSTATPETTEDAPLNLLVILLAGAMLVSYKKKVRRKSYPFPCDNMSEIEG